MFKLPYTYLKCSYLSIILSQQIDAHYYYCTSDLIVMLVKQGPRVEPRSIVS